MTAPAILALNPDLPNVARESPESRVAIGSSSTDQHHRTVLAGRELLAARIGWLATALVTIAFFLAALPARYAALVGTISNLTPAQQAVLADLKISGLQHIRLVFAVEILVATVFFSVGLLIFSRRSDDWMALLISLTQITYIAWADPSLRALAAAQPTLLLPITVIQTVAMVSSTSTFLLFPSGEFVPRWSKLLLGGSVVWAFAWLLFPTSALSLADPYHLPLPTFWAMLTCYLTGIGFQIYRFRRENGAERRRQTLFVVIGETTAVLAYVVFGFDRFALPVVTGPTHAAIVYDLVGVPIFLILATLIPATLAVSILRYRLMEIEVILNQALVYGALTAVVAGLFPASMATLERLFTLITGEKSDVATVVTTLIFAASLTPLKNLLERLLARSLKPASDPMANLNELAAHARMLVELLEVEQVVQRGLDDAIRCFDASSGAVYLTGRGLSRPFYVRGDSSRLDGPSARIEYRGQPYGRIVLGHRRGGRPYGHHDELILAEIGRGLGYVIRLEQVVGLDRSANHRGTSIETVLGARK